MAFLSRDQNTQPEDLDPSPDSGGGAEVTIDDACELGFEDVSGSGMSTLGAGFGLSIGSDLFKLLASVGA